ncbi:endonuclease VII domain-containing protein [Streptomyces sp. NBC_01751]|uniref:endonuclease VII domain-containing protein n=1 Tax=Streptomyces sp. NBC_01751 TaxID=2975929 RepID=UPI003FA3DA26
MKRCPDCGETKPYGDYYRSAARPDGCASVCKECSKARVKAHRKGTYVPRREQFPEGMRRCPRCRELKSLEAAFNKASSRKNGYAVWCRDCASAHSRDRRAAIPLDVKRAEYAANRDAIRAKVRQNTYGITAEEYDALLADQGGGCGVCGIEACTTGKAFAVDHDHACCPGRKSCGKCIRGLLCTNCNQGLGKFKDDPKLLRNAIDYLAQ